MCFSTYLVAQAAHTHRSHVRVFYLSASLYVKKPISSFSSDLTKSLVLYLFQNLSFLSLSGPFVLSLSPYLSACYPQHGTAYSPPKQKTRRLRRRRVGAFRNSLLHHEKSSLLLSACLARGATSPPPADALPLVFSFFM